MASAKAKQDKPTGIEIDGELVELDMDDLTLGEAEELEDYFGHWPVEAEWESAKGLLFIAYLGKKRKKPNTTLDDIRKVKISKVGEGKEKRPTKERATSGSQS